MGRETAYFWPCPLGPLGGVKRSNIDVKFRVQGQFQRMLYLGPSIPGSEVIPNFVCVFTNKRYKTYRQNLLPGSYPRSGTLGFWRRGGQKKLCGDLRWHSIDCAFLYFIGWQGRPGVGNWNLYSLSHSSLSLKILWLKAPVNNISVMLVEHQHD